MKVFHHFETLPEEARGAVVALGNFDGVHLGHAGLLAAARADATVRGLSLAVLTFEPHPREYFEPEGKPFRLTTAQEKSRLLAENGVDILYVLPFDAAFSQMSAADFQEKVLARGLNAAAIAAGTNFRFGRNREGTLAEIALPIITPPIITDKGGRAISSTLVREALQKGDPVQAASLLGHDWTIDYTVELGDQRGRELGYPTANGRLGVLLRPAFGIYAVRAYLEDGQVKNGAANIGIRPMWQSREPLVETFLFDFAGDLYGQTLRITLVEYLRPEEKFPDIEALKRQMAKDCEKARAILK